MNKRKFMIGGIVGIAVLIPLAIAVIAICNHNRPKYVENVIMGRPANSIDATKVDADGIDVSHHNGRINWKKVAENGNIKFAYVKATEGTGYKDDRFVRNVREARKAGLEVGAYHFFTKAKSGKEQFEHFRNTVGHKHIGTLIPMVDVEDSGIGGMKVSSLRMELKTFCQLIKQEYGRKPVIYTKSGIYNQCLIGEFDDYYIWISRYGRQPRLRNDGKYNIWQFTERGYVEGIGGYTDLNSLMNDMTVEKLKLNL